MVKIGISSCLLGNKVRYDGEQKLNKCLIETLGPRVDWVPVCPEFECGFGIPREKVHLVGSLDAPRLVTIGSKKDLTDKMNHWIAGKLNELEKEHLGGFIFKKRSPSCSSFSGVEIYAEDGKGSQSGMGLFAKAFVERFPLIPVDDEERLQDDQKKEEFFAKIISYQKMGER